MIIQRLLILQCIGVNVALAGNGGASLPLPRHDPFAQPVLKKIEPVKTRPGNSLSETDQAWAPVLTSTLRAGPNSMVIVGGRVVKIGEQVEGYRLLEVGEQQALFEKDGAKIRIRLED